MAIIVNADNLVVGRLSSWVAKRILDGQEIIIINSEKAVVIGSKRGIVEDFHAKHVRGEQYRGPFYPRMPHLILRRVVRGMLPYNKARGRLAFRRVKTYIGVPPGIDLTKCVPVEDAKVRGDREHMNLGEISSRLGSVWNATYPSPKVSLRPSAGKKEAPAEAKKEAKIPQKKEAPKKKEGAARPKEHAPKEHRKPEHAKEDKDKRTEEAK
jgi:large subunit ribosomal protein L13